MESDLKFHLNGEKGRLDKVLTKLMPDHSRSFIQKLIQGEQVKVDGQFEKANYKLSGDELLEVSIVEEAPIEIEGEDIPLNIVYEDDDLLVINKPAGMVVHPSKGHSSGTLVNALIYYLENHQREFSASIRPGIVHRLDKDTSGLLIVAKQQQSLQRLSEALSQRKVGRKYQALVHGQVEANEGYIEAPLARDPKQRLRWHVDWEGKEALTKFWVKERFQEATLLEVELLTGRTHQIRVHMEFIGHPIVGDPVYRKGIQNYRGPLTQIEDGQYLHAYHLDFVHPMTGEKLTFEADLPENFQAILLNLM